MAGKCPNGAGHSLQPAEGTSDWHTHKPHACVIVPECLQPLSFHHQSPKTSTSDGKRTGRWVDS